MKAITRYQAVDGTEFPTEHQCREYEQLRLLVAGVMSYLGTIPDEVKDGKGWLQHDPETVVRCRVGIIRLCRSMPQFDSFPVFRHEPAAEIHPNSSAGRILDDTGGPLSEAWYRFRCIDDQGREHQQPYFAINGPDDNHECIEDRR